MVLAFAGDSTMTRRVVLAELATALPEGARVPQPGWLTVIKGNAASMRHVRDARHADERRHRTPVGKPGTYVYPFSRRHVRFSDPSSGRCLRRRIAYQLQQPGQPPAPHDAVGGPAGARPEQRR